MVKLFEELKPVPVLGKTLVSGTETTDTIGFGDSRRILFFVLVEAADEQWIINNTGKVGKVALKLVERKGLAGATNDLREDIDLDCGVGVTKAKIEALHEGGWAVENTITINEVVLKKVTSSPDASEGEFTTAANLAAAINAVVPGVTATVADTNDVIVEADIGTSFDIDADIDGTSDGELVSINETTALVEVHISELDLADDYNSVHLHITDADATGNVSATAVAIKGNAYRQPVEQLAAVVSAKTPAT